MGTVELTTCVVEDCATCPFCVYTSPPYDGPRCDYADISLDTDDEIPGWCPLPLKIVLTEKATRKMQLNEETR